MLCAAPLFCRQHANPAMLSVLCTRRIMSYLHALVTCDLHPLKYMAGHRPSCTGTSMSDMPRNEMNASMYQCSGGRSGQVPRGHPGDDLGLPRPQGLPGCRAEVPRV